MTQSVNSFPEIVRSEAALPTMFEVIPPRRDAAAEKQEAWRDRILKACAELHCDAINIPEVRDESRAGERTYTYAKRIKPREFGRALSEAAPAGLNVVINRVVVYRTVAQQKTWLKNSHQLGMRNLILVGGESSRVTYPGPSVSQAARLIREEVNTQLPPGEQFFCGGIVIPTRRRPDSRSDEPVRLVQKIKNGLEFFSSQVIYEADKTCSLLADYARACEEAQIKPVRIFLSLAPVGQTKHIEFLRWLGVEVPPGTEAELSSDDARIGETSIEICARIFERIRNFVAAEKLPVPLGLNISPLIRSNFDLGVRLAERLAVFA